MGKKQKKTRSALYEPVLCIVQRIQEGSFGTGHWVKTANNNNDSDDDKMNGQIDWEEVSCLVARWWGCSSYLRWCDRYSTEQPLLSGPTCLPQLWRAGLVVGSRGHARLWRTGPPFWWTRQQAEPLVATREPTLQGKSAVLYRPVWALQGKRSAS